MNVQDVSAHWVALHEELGVGAPVRDETQYLQLLDWVEKLVDATGGDDTHPLWALISLTGDRIREYEDRTHPWPNNSTPATVLAFLLQQHGLRQGDLPEIGSQGVVSEILAGKRPLNLRQVKALAQRFSVPMEVLSA
jgi:HTH-type transcriptional regulator / antitoxin HigA